MRKNEFLLKNYTNRRALESQLPGPRIAPHDEFLATCLMIVSCLAIQLNLAKSFLLLNCFMQIRFVYRFLFFIYYITLTN